MLYIIDYTNPYEESIDCLVVEADFPDDAMDEAIEILKKMGIPKRYILKMEEF